MRGGGRERPRILLTNDDGIYSQGLLEAKSVLEELGDVIVIAPFLQQSGIGRAISLFKPLRIHSVRLRDGTRAYAVSGTPVDAVTLGIHVLMKGKVDLVVSGINLGENVSMESITTSGTVCAAIEAANMGIPAIAISQEVHEGLKFEDSQEVELDLRIAKRVLRALARLILDRGLPEGVDLLNVNIPEGAGEDSEIAITRLARRIFRTQVEVREDPRARPYYWIAGTTDPRLAEPGTDAYALFVEKKITITPLSLDMTAKVNLKLPRRLKDLERF